MPQAALLTGCDDGFAKISALTAPAMRRYADRYQMTFLQEQFTAMDRSPAWGKITAIKKTLNAGYDPVIWIDGDALIVDDNHDIRLAADSGKDIFWADKNSGVMVSRSSPWSLWFLDEIWRNKLEPEHSTWEQAAMLHVLGHRAVLGRGEQDCLRLDLLEHIGELDGRWNRVTLLHPSRDAFIRHYAGIELEARIALIRRDLMAPRIFGRIAHPISRLAYAVDAFDRRMARKIKTSRSPLWYRAKRVVGRAFRLLLWPAY